MKRLSLIIATICFFLSFEAKSQVVYVTEWKTEANKKVYITKNPAEADIIVFKSEWKSDAAEASGIWFFTEWKTEADMLIYFTEWKSEADLVICYTTDKGEAGKRN